MNVMWQALKEEIEYQLEYLNEDVFDKPLELTTNQKNEIVENLLENDYMWETINECITDEIMAYKNND